MFTQGTAGSDREFLAATAAGSAGGGISGEPRTRDVIDCGRPECHEPALSNCIQSIATSGNCDGTAACSVKVTC